MTQHTPNREDGYATAAVLGVVAFLSLLAVWNLNNAAARARLIDAQMRQVQLDYAITGALHEELFRIVQDPDRVSFRADRIEMGGVSVILEREDEQSYPNFRSLSNDRLEGELRRLLPPGTDVFQIMSLRERMVLNDALPKHLSDFLDIEELPFRVRRCLAERFTIYSSSINPLARSERRSMSGAILRLEIKSAPNTAPQLRYRIVFLITGRNDKPYYILDVVRDNQAHEPNCATPI